MLILASIIARSFTGKTTRVSIGDVHYTSVLELKEAIVASKAPAISSPTSPSCQGSSTARKGGEEVWQMATRLFFKGHELRDHRTLAFYGIEDGSLVNIGEQWIF